LINLHGSHLPTVELANTQRLVYVETDPVEVEIDLFHGCQKTQDYLAPHCAFFTYGENLNQPDCLVPSPVPYTFLPTRQPVILDLWQPVDSDKDHRFTTIGNWRQPWREVSFQGQVYRWSKHFEFEKFLDLPHRSSQEFELALSSSSLTAEDRQRLEGHGWHVRDALEFSNDLPAYRQYVAESRGEFTVAKDQNIRLRSGWFSDRAATYLAAGRPVVSQDTAFDSALPTGKGLFSFRTLEDVLNALDEINAHYAANRQAARAIAHEHFDHRIVLGNLLRQLGCSPAAHGRPSTKTSSNLPDELVIQPVSRWPTRVPEATWDYASRLPPPSAVASPASDVVRASIIVVTHNGLPYTRLCLSTLLEAGWNPQDELLIVDNASADGTPAFLRELESRLPFVRVLLNSNNRGFAAANNQGLAHSKGQVMILLNNDTLVLPGWQDRLVEWLQDPGLGLVGPVTNRTCNEAQIDAPYRTYGELRRFAHEYTQERREQATDLPMLAMFCLAFRRDVFARVGPLDEQFEVGMFEDDDYAKRVCEKGYRIACVEDVYVHHFGQASIGELCDSGDYDQVLNANRQKFEKKWKVQWQPHGRRTTPEYSRLRERLLEFADARLPADAVVLVISKGDEALLNLPGRWAWHFPRSEDGEYANLYPADSAEAIEQLENLRARGATHLVIPRPGFWWLEFYDGWSTHLKRHYPVLAEDPNTCMIFNLGGSHA
jgi:GT2 family glycosyltransferase